MTRMTDMTLNIGNIGNIGVASHQSVCLNYHNRLFVIPSIIP